MEGSTWNGPRKGPRKDLRNGPRKGPRKGEGSTGGSTGASTEGIAMSIMCQSGELSIFSSESGCELWKEPIVVALRRLGSLTAETLLRVFRLDMPLLPWEDSKLQAALLYTLYILLMDSMSSNLKCVRYLIAVRRQPKNRILAIPCNCHQIHIASTDQIDRLDIALPGVAAQPPPLPIVADAGAAPALADPQPGPAHGELPAGRGRGKGKGKRARGNRRCDHPPVEANPAAAEDGGGKGKGEANPAAAEDGGGKGKGEGKAKGKSKVKTVKKKFSTGTISSLVRGTHIFELGSAWRLIISDFETFVSSNLHIVAEEDIPQDQASIQQRADALTRNRSLLEEFGVITTDSTPKCHLDTVSTQFGNGLLELIGETLWNEGSTMTHFARGICPSRAMAVLKVTACARGAFVRDKPAKPARGRWTGTVNAACWFGRLTKFFGFLQWSMRRTLAGTADILPQAILAALEEPRDAAGVVHFAAEDIGESVQVQAGIRKRLFAEFILDAHSPLKLYLLGGSVNKPSRRLLHFIFKHEAPAFRDDVDRAKIIQRYRLGGMDSAEEQDTNDDAGYFMRWCSGEITGASLKEWAEMMLGGEDGTSRFEATLLMEFGNGEEGLIITQRCILGGSANALLPITVVCLQLRG